MALLLLGACATPSTEPPTPRAPQIAAPVDGSWSFTTGDETCQAQVGHRGLALTIRAGPGPTIVFQPTPAGGLGFAGSGGRWRMRRAELGPGTNQPLDRALPRVQTLLDGGIISLGSGRLLRAPDAGVAGRDWFGCLARLGSPS